MPQLAAAIDIAKNLRELIIGYINAHFRLNAKEIVDLQGHRAESLMRHSLVPVPSVVSGQSRVRPD